MEAKISDRAMRTYLKEQCVNIKPPDSICFILTLQSGSKRLEEKEGARRFRQCKLKLRHHKNWSFKIPISNQNFYRSLNDHLVNVVLYNTGPNHSQSTRNETSCYLLKSAEVDTCATKGGVDLQ